MTPIRALLEATIKYSSDQRLTEIGHEMFRLYTELGFPPDTFMDKIKEYRPIDQLQAVYILSVYHHDFLEHKRLAGAGAKNIENTRKNNQREIASLLKNDEIGAY